MRSREKRTRKNVQQWVYVQFLSRIRFDALFARISPSNKSPTGHRHLHGLKPIARLSSAMPPKIRAVFSDEKNPRGIPKAPFIVRVSAYLCIIRFDVCVCVITGRCWRIPWRSRCWCRSDIKKFPRCFSVRFHMDLFFLVKDIHLMGSAASTVIWTRV